MRVAILEDDRALGDTIAHTLQTRALTPHLFRTGASLIAALKREPFDLVVLGSNPADTSGTDLRGWVREHLEIHPPLLSVIGADAETDAVRALNLKPTDYVVHPIRKAELLARAEALLCRGAPSRGAGVQTFGEVRFDANNQSVNMAGQEIITTNKEFCLALMLFQNLDRALSRAYLLEKIWHVSADLQTRTLDAHVSRIRSKLGLRPQAGYRLAPVYSYGYRLEKFASVPELA